MGFEWDGYILHDPLQMVRVAFLYPSEDGPGIELIEPAGHRSPVNEFLSRGGGLHHICLEVQDLMASIGEARRAGSVLVRFPCRAAAFQNRRIAWIRTQHGQLVEFLSAHSAILIEGACNQMNRRLEFIAAPGCSPGHSRGLRRIRPAILGVVFADIVASLCKTYTTLT
jgi:methylmalonyl-CoA/ethylmalonyl-CoA epimerase